MHLVHQALLRECLKVQVPEPGARNAESVSWDWAKEPACSELQEDTFFSLYGFKMFLGFSKF